MILHIPSDSFTFDRQFLFNNGQTPYYIHHTCLSVDTVYHSIYIYIYFLQLLLSSRVCQVRGLKGVEALGDREAIEVSTFSTLRWLSVELACGKYFGGR